MVKTASSRHFWINDFILRCLTGSRQPALFRASYRPCASTSVSPYKPTSWMSRPRTCVKRLPVGVLGIKYSPREEICPGFQPRHTLSDIQVMTSSIVRMGDLEVKSQFTDVYTEIRSQLWWCFFKENNLRWAKHSLHVKRLSPVTILLASVSVLHAHTRLY